jgi:hypothetical protein
VTPHDAAVVDANVIAALKLYDPAGLPGTMLVTAVRASGREPRKRASDLMIAATAARNELPLYTANPDDFKGAEAFVQVVGLKAHPNSL